MVYISYIPQKRLKRTMSIKIVLKLYLFIQKKMLVNKFTRLVFKTTAFRISLSEQSIQIKPNVRCHGNKCIYCPVFFFGLVY